MFNGVIGVHTQPPNPPGQRLVLRSIIPRVAVSRGVLDSSLRALGRRGNHRGVGTCPLDWCLSSSSLGAIVLLVRGIYFGMRHKESTVLPPGDGNRHRLALPIEFAEFG